MKRFLVHIVMMVVMVGVCPQIAAAAASVYSIRFDLADSDGNLSGIVNIEFNAVGFNEWVDVDALQGLGCSGVMIFCPHRLSLTNLLCVLTITALSGDVTNLRM